MTQKNWPDRVYCLNSASLKATKIFEITCRIQVKILFDVKQPWIAVYFSRILPSVAIVVTLQGIIFPLFCKAFFTA